jgi:biotin transport system substrate-specific component
VIKAFTFPIAPAARPATWLQASGVVLAGSAFVAVCAQFALPLYFTPVPLSMAPFAVLVLGLVLSPRLAAATLGAYLAEGALGLPVFAPGPLAGIAHLMGPTAGYLLAYPFAAALISWLSRRGGRGFTTLLASAAVGNLFLLAGGAVWMAALTHAAASAVFSLSVVPFLPGDALKVVAAAGLATSFQRLRNRKP